jgi:hypothetical protein
LPSRSSKYSRCEHLESIAIQSGVAGEIFEVDNGLWGDAIEKSSATRFDLADYHFLQPQEENILI